ncbi:hypothetical protein K469DRAFT_181955 [Zopfia rhizophila CBS 207.26]|uniref:Rhodopsin domain-containing protein n=1 Tax=Zopfia rhizophila CBS 207.26 TaxID=1314779 RepID=A0A6A6E1J3_9PEZI|nr:hypothetical protein K469DRAFT_181955 [Zopfia rhizophila CBS 207.26]
MSDQRPILIGLNVALMALTFAAICSRVGRRIVVIGTWNHHDVLISLAAICAFIFSICLMIGTSFGLGQHAYEVSDTQIPKLIKLVIISNVFYFACNWFVKHALLVFYSEIVREKKYQGSIYFMHFVAFGFGLSSILVNLFQCMPFRKVYTPKLPGYCVNLNIFFYCNASIMLATDIVLYVMPVVFTWHLQLRRPQRIGLNCLFALGGIVLAASAARVQSVHLFATKPDFPWRFANAMIWSVLENHLAIVVACAPSIKVIALLVFPRLMSSYHKVMSKVTPSYSRSRSRASAPFGTNDLESGTRKSDKLKPTPSSTPLPSPALTVGSGGSRASRGFARWFKGPASPRQLDSSDSMDHGLVFAEEGNAPQGRDVHMVNISRGEDNDKKWREERESGKGLSSPSGENDIRVERTIQVESARESSEDDIQVLGRAA